MLKKWLENNVHKVNVKEMTKTTYVKSMLKIIADKAIERH